MDYIANLQTLVRTFNWHAPSWDLFIILFWLVTSVIYAFAAGRGRILSILMSVYMAKLLVIEAPFLSDVIAQKLPGSMLALQQLIIFGILFVILFIFLSRYAFKSSADSRKMSSVGFGVIFSILQVGLLINIVINYLPDSIKNGFAPLIQFIFIQSLASFVWLVLPVAFLIALGRFISEKSEF